MSVNLRRLRNQILFPKIQFKFALLMTAIIVCSSIAIYITSNSINKQISISIQESGSSDTLQLVNALTSYQSKVILAINLVSILAIFLVTIFVTHRFVGPIIAIIKHLESIKENKASTLHARPDDAMGPLIEYLNSVDIQVTAKKK